MSTLPPLPPAPAARRSRGLGLKIAIGIALLAIVGGALLWRAGKGSYRNYQMASAGAERFHQQLNAGEYDQIYENSTDEFRHWGSRDKLKEFFDNVRNKMGAAGKASTVGFHVNWRNGVVWVDQTLNTHFEKGKAQEYFVWKIQQDQPHLYNYRIDALGLHESGAAK